MADTTNPTTPQGDGSTDKPAPGVSDAAPTLPDASIEPAAQVASSMASEPPLASGPASTASTHVPPPIPADYEMPDDYASDQDLLTKIKAWAEAHPGLAVVAAAGAGLLIGRVVTGLFPDSEPPSLAERVEKRAKVYRKKAKKESKLLEKQAKKQGKVLKKQGKEFRAEALAFADEAGDSLQEALHRASEALREAAYTAGEAAEDGYERTKDFTEHMADTIKDALSSKIDDWAKR